MSSWMDFCTDVRVSSSVRWTSWSVNDEAPCWSAWAKPFWGCDVTPCYGITNPDERDHVKTTMRHLWCLTKKKPSSFFIWFSNGTSGTLFSKYDINHAGTVIQWSGNSVRKRNWMLNIHWVLEEHPSRQHLMYQTLRTSYLQALPWFLPLFSSALVNPSHN